MITCRKRAKTKKFYRLQSKKFKIVRKTFEKAKETMIEVSLTFLTRQLNLLRPKRRFESFDIHHHTLCNSQSTIDSELYHHPSPRRE